LEPMGGLTGLFSEVLLHSLVLVVLSRKSFRLCKHCSFETCTVEKCAFIWEPKCNPSII